MSKGVFILDLNTAKFIGQYSTQARAKKALLHGELCQMGHKYAIVKVLECLEPKMTFTLSDISDSTLNLRPSDSRGTEEEDVKLAEEKEEHTGLSEIEDESYCDAQELSLDTDEDEDDQSANSMTETISFTDNEDHKLEVDDKIEKPETTESTKIQHQDVGGLQYSLDPLKTPVDSEDPQDKEAQIEEQVQFIKAEEESNSEKEEPETTSDVDLILDSSEIEDFDETTF